MSDSSSQNSNKSPFGDDAKDENAVQETTLSTVPKTESIRRLMETERIRPKEPDQILVSHDVTTKFEVVDQNGDPIYYLVQADACCSRNRWFTLDVYDTDEMHVGHLERPTGCVSCFCGCCSQSLKVNFPPKKFIGEVNQKWSFFGSPKYQTQNAGRDLIFVLEGRNCCGVEKIRLYNGMQEKIGKLKSQWDGLPENKFTSQTCYGLVFPKNLDLEHKHLLVATAFLMGHNYFDLHKKVTHEELIPMKQSS